MNEVSIPVVAILAWAAIVIYRTYEGSKRREMAHRERLAMIERGLVPSPEADPERFERAMGWHRDYVDRRGGSIRGGLILIAVGIGVGLIIALAGHELGAGIGVGSMLILIGIALLVSSAWETRPAQPGPPAASPSSTEPREPR